MTYTIRRTGTILDEIIDHKCREVAERKEIRPLGQIRRAAETARPPRSFAQALQTPGVSLIAEVKRASPSKGQLRTDLDPARLAQRYADNGAAAVSVLTDRRFFQGDLNDLEAVRESVPLPVLQKDFILEPYQVYEARAAGADALLLIVAALNDERLEELYRLTCRLDMAALVEVHNDKEVARALALEPQIIGINNRDLHTFDVDLATTARLQAAMPDDTLVVSESGIHSAADVARLVDIGVDAMLVGTALVTAPDPAHLVRTLIHAGQKDPAP